MDYRHSCTVITKITDWIQTFAGNKNPGTPYEICVGISILLDAGLASREELPEEYKNIKEYKKYTNIKGIINLTQKDNIGGTGDIGIIFDDDSIKYYSVTQWKKKLAKCICNPTGKHYDISRTDETEKINDEAYELALKYRKDNKGEIPNKKWKRIGGGKCPGAKLMCEYLAKKASESWNKKSGQERKEILFKFIDTAKEKQNVISTNADGIIYWDTKKNIIAGIYKWTLNINLDDYLTTFNDGIYICHGTPENIILKTQAKYNNGIIEGMSSKISHENWSPKKSSNYISSWDCVVPDLNKIFKMEKLISLK